MTQSAESPVYFEIINKFASFVELVACPVLVPNTAIAVTTSRDLVCCQVMV